MGRRFAIMIAFAATVTTPASAQFVVLDPGNLAQVVLIAQRAQQVYEQLQAEYQVITRMGRGLGDLSGYRIPSIAISALDASRFPYGRPWIDGMNTGDARATGYFATTVPLQRPDDMLEQVDSTARQMFENRYATVEISDSVASMGGHQVALLRAYHAQLQQAVEQLQGDVMSQAPGYHDLTAVLDKISAAELLGRRQDMATNQLLSHALEQLLARTKRERDTEAATINMQLTSWREGSSVNAAFASGTGDALRTWRQP